MNHFTVEQAQALITKLEQIFQRALALRDRAEEKISLVHTLEKNTTTSPADALLAQSQADFLVNQIKGQMREIEKLGGIPKGLEPGLVDFPAKINGEEAYICWQHGEKSITHYHGVDEGFAGRKPLHKSSLPKEIQ